MNLTRRFGSGRGRLSLRSRLLAGLITVTALFLIIMGVVTTVVLGNSEQSQFNSDLSLTARIKLTEVADLTGGYGVVYINIPTRKVGVLSPPSAATAELQALVSDLLTNKGARRYFGQQGNPQRVLFGISLPGHPAADRDLAADLCHRGGAQPGPGPRGHQHPADRAAEQRGGQRGPRPGRRRADHRLDPARPARGGRPLADQPRAWRRSTGWRAPPT